MPKTKVVRLVFALLKINHPTQPLNAFSPIRRFRVALCLFIAGLVLSGVTAFPLLLELRVLTDLLGVGYTPGPTGHDGLVFWLQTVRQGLEQAHVHYPWMAYGTDWLAFGHLVIALFFVGPLIQPASSRTVLLTGIAACVGVVPLALICGAMRGIPLYWRLLDCSFGVIGVVPLTYCLRLLPQIEAEAARAASQKVSGFS